MNVPVCKKEGKLQVFDKKECGEVVKVKMKERRVGCLKNKKKVRTRRSEWQTVTGGV
jgi:hypothetical protein